MDYLVVCLAALLASGLTLFSGFGLGTILTPVFVLFFPVPAAIAMTAVVHLANNLFKIGLVGRDANWRVVAGFALLELWPRFAKLSFPTSWLPLGGLLSGFFGGLSGNQGALRSAFLIKAGLSKQAYVGTGAACTVLVDAVRLTVYDAAFQAGGWQVLQGGNGNLVLAATLSAFLGAYVGKRLLKKITLRFVELTVATMMVLIGTGLASGLL